MDDAFINKKLCVKDRRTGRSANGIMTERNEPVIEDVEIRKLKKKSLELAGLFDWN